MDPSQDPDAPVDVGREEPLPWQQFLLDDVFLLTMAGLVVPTLFYIVWGLMELSNVPLWTP